MKKVQKLLHVVLGVVSVSHAAPQLTLDAFDFEALDKAYSDISENIAVLKVKYLLQVRLLEMGA